MPRPGPFPHCGNILSIVWKIRDPAAAGFHCVEKKADFFHTVENRLAPARGRSAPEFAAQGFGRQLRVGLAAGELHDLPH